MRRICASQVFSAGLSPPCTAQVLSAFQVIVSDEGKGRIKQLNENSDLMRRELTNAGLYVIGDYGSAVIPMLICQPGKIAYCSRLLLWWWGSLRFLSCLRGFVCVSLRTIRQSRSR